MHERPHRDLGVAPKPAAEDGSRAGGRSGPARRRVLLTVQRCAKTHPFAGGDRCSSIRGVGSAAVLSKDVALLEGIVALVVLIGIQFVVT